MSKDMDKIWCQPNTGKNMTNSENITRMDFFHMSEKGRIEARPHASQEYDLCLGPKGIVRKTTDFL